jgi:hypothetical protein
MTTMTTRTQTQPKFKRKREEPAASLFGMEPSLSVKEQQHLALLMKHFRPELGLLATQKYEEARKAYDRETEALVAPMLEPVPEPLLLPPLTFDIARYLAGLFTDLKAKDISPTMKMLLHVVKLQNAQIVKDFDFDDPGCLQLDGYIFLKMLQHKLPPCVVTEEHIVAFCRYVAQKKKALLQRKFQDEMVDEMLDMCEPLHELF